MKVLRATEIFRAIVVLTPMLLGFMFIVLNLLPHSISLMWEPYQPWYTPYTTLLFLPLNILMYPTTVATSIVAGPDAVAGPVQFAFVIVYSGCLTSVLFRISKLDHLKDAK